LKDKQKRRDNLFSVRPPVTQPKKTETPVSVGIKRQRLFNLSIDLLCIATLDGWFQDLNPAWERVLGFSCEELYSKPYLEFVHPDDRESTIRSARELSGDTVLTFENRFLCRDGSYRWLSWNSYPVPEHSLVYAVVRDVTDRRQMETAFRSLQETLQKTNEELEAGNKELVALNEELTATNEELRVTEEELKQQLEELRLAEEALRESEERYRAVADFAYDWEYWLSPDWRFIYVSPSCERITGYSTDAFLADPELLNRIIHPEDQAIMASHVHTVSTNGEVLPIDFRIVNRAGEVRWIGHICHPVYRADGTFLGRRACNRDITEQKRAQEELSFQKASFEQLFENSPQGIVMLDTSHKIVIVNTGFKRLFQYSIDEIVGRNIGNLVVPEGLHGEAASVLDAAFSGNTVQQMESVRRRKDGSLVEVSILVYPILVDRNQVGIYVIYEDISERKQAEERLKYLNLHDPLTGLYNRTYFEEEMHRLEGDRYAPVGVIVCDVDGLKLVNDTLGHTIGDKLLQAVADVLRQSSRTSDMIARIGGDEFAVLFPNVSESIVQNVVERIRNAIAVYNETHPELPLSLSTGFAVDSGDPTSIEDLFKEADNNMYREKLHRRRSVRSTIVRTLMKALEARDFITEGHADRLQDLVSDLARAINLPESHDLRLLAQFHDIGKVGIPDRILFKPQQLTPEERTEMQRHCEIGHRIALSAPDLAPIADWILKHHEWWNGQGYPLGLKGEEIPLECRILAIADAYDAMTNDRPYRKAMSKTAALEELRRCAGSQFDPELTQVFVQLLSNDEPG
jgi:diguanylate cyclase (GGDEF)-like protein/PAS domain S-box-containing protein